LSVISPNGTNSKKRPDRPRASGGESVAAALFQADSNLNASDCLALHLICTFWLADNLFLLGRHAEARELFERLLSLRNDVGLLSEQYDSQSRRFLGTFPQAFSHIGLINTALT
jgi:GH15 family glucan-1,4-alpha-glucosidase